MVGIKGMKIKSPRTKPQNIYDGRICDYGCENIAKYEFKNGKVSCSTFGGNCPAKRKIASEKFKKNVSCIDPISGIKKSKLMALKGAETLRNIIDVETGLTMDIILRQKIGKIKKESGSAKRAAKKMIQQRKKNIDPNTNFDQNKQIALKGKETRLNDIDINGFNSYERMWMKSKTLSTQFKETELYYQSLNEYNFLEQNEYRINDINRGPSINYTDPLDNTPRTYFPDFLIDNIIYEIKSFYSWREWHGKPQKDKNIAKLNATLDYGFEVILVIDGIEMHWPVSILD